MFEGFSLEQIKLPEATLRVRVGGGGPPLLMLHGHPRTHATWHRVAPILAEEYTVVCPDLRGFGQSSKPVDMPDHSGSSKRSKAGDCLALMDYLGFDRFGLVGHDRGAYTAFRTAMDHPASVSRLAILEAIPIGDALARCDARFASAWWHWFFFAQPEKPEQAILANPDAWYGGDPAEMGAEAYADFLASIHDPATVHGMIEDYRAGLGIDRQHDEDDRAAGRKLECPLLVLWSAYDDLEELHGDVIAIWREWSSNVHGNSLNCHHHMAEEVPETLAAELGAFFHDQ
ncbi:alpha/beta hydrolase [Bradyrhizobium sp. 186]|uniref:alpha/beta fold hydrolase n=1 Tax=Bradyrhizobium sp. 186 TaxID=2782654 RepID=UPI002000DA5E|nr:alpha/beta hydrolase [Bradyrhizobium sp. 186]UPK32786.1 alpha/beta hydrolase [Bradyrhizobium sp. 186]